MANKADFVKLAENVVDQLNAKQGGWVKSFKAERYYNPSLKLEETGQVRCLVAMSDLRVSADNRTDWEFEFDIDIGLLYKSDPKKGEQPQSAFDEMMLLVQQMQDYWLETRALNEDCPLKPDAPLSYPNGIYIQEHIGTLSQFSSVMRLTFWKLRPADA